MRSRLPVAALLFVVFHVAIAGRASQATLPAPFGALQTLSTPALDGAAQPNLATDARGRVWLTWLEPRPGGGHRFRLSSLSAGRWSAPTTIAEGTNFLANWADFPSLFVAADGTMAAHWLERGESRAAQYGNETALPEHKLSSDRNDYILLFWPIQ